MTLARDPTIPTDPILDTGFLNTGHVERFRACHLMEAKIMKHHVLPHGWRNFGCLQDETELLDRYCPTSSTENSSKQSVRSVHKSAPFLSDMVFVSVPSVLKNQENYPPRYAHDLAVGPAAHLLVISCFSAKLGFQANYVRSKRETSPL